MPQSQALPARSLGGMWHRGPPVAAERSDQQHLQGELQRHLPPPPAPGCERRGPRSQAQPGNAEWSAREKMASAGCRGTAAGDERSPRRRRQGQG